jgi:hypothetical protein
MWDDSLSGDSQTLKVNKLHPWTGYEQNCIEPIMALYSLVLFCCRGEGNAAIPLAGFHSMNSESGWILGDSLHFTL